MKKDVTYWFDMGLEISIVLCLISSTIGLFYYKSETNYLKAENARLISENTALKNKIKCQTKLDSSKDVSEFDILVMSVIEVESGGNPNAVNGISNGLMQINGGSFDADANIISGSKMLANLIAKSVNNTAEAVTAEQILHRSLTAYNRGWTGANKYRAKHGTFCSDYSKKVLENYKQMTRRNNENTAFNVIVTGEKQVEYRKNQSG